MERTLVLSAFAVGCLGCLVGLLGTWRALRRSGPAISVGGALPRLTLFLCLFVPLLVFVCSLPEGPPFAAGQGFGRGFLIGALGAALAAFMVFRAQDDGAEDGFASGILASGPLFAAAVCVSIPILWMHTVLTDALLGVAIGWFVNSFLVLVASPGDPLGRRCASAVTVGVGYMVTLAATSAIGDYRGVVDFAHSALPVSWRAIVAVIGALIPLLMFGCTLPTGWLLAAFSRLPLFGFMGGVAGRLVRDDRTLRLITSMWRIVPGAMLMLWGANLFATRTADRPHLLLIAGIGLFVGTISWWLAHGIGDERTDRREAGANSRQNGALAIILVLSGVMAAYQIMAGVGVGLMLLSAWFSAGLALHGARGVGVADEKSAGNPAANDGSLVTAALMFGSILCLYRLFEVRFSLDLHGVSLTDHYALFGFLMGALLPVLLAGYLRRQSTMERAGPNAATGRALVAGALVLAVPFVLLLLFGAKCATALYFGLAVGAALALIQPADNRQRSPDGSSAPSPGNVTDLLPLFALAVALALAQWTHHVTPIALFARGEKLRLLGYLAGALIALLLTADYGGRLRDWRRTRRGAVDAGSAERRAEP